MPLVAEVLRPEGINLFNNPLIYSKLLSVLKALKEGGVQLVEKGSISKKILRMISQPACDSSTFRKVADIYWHDLIDKGQYNY